MTVNTGVQGMLELADRIEAGHAGGDFVESDRKLVVTALRAAVIMDPHSKAICDSYAEENQRLSDEIARLRATAPAKGDEPVAWLYEMAFYIKPSDENPFRDWKQVVTVDAPVDSPKGCVRNIEPLYARPFSDRPASVQDGVREWRCFHCDETFTDPVAAKDHFGYDMLAEPGCKLNQIEGGLLGILRRQEERLDAYHREDTASYREFYSLGADHYRALRSEEEKGYARGLADGQALAGLPPEQDGSSLVTRPVLGGEK